MEKKNDIISATISNQASISGFADILSGLLAGRELSPGQMQRVMHALMTGEFEEAQAGAFLVALRMKGETGQEVASAAQVLRQHMVSWKTGRDNVLDTCGTGGDGSGTFNISTATAIVTAAAGVPVVKHGNRSVSSNSGSADVLSELGVNIECDTEVARRCLDQAGLAFCFAPAFHPAMRHIAPVRRSLGVATLFNCLGPLANPAGAAFQLLGVGRKDLLDLMATALRQLGTKRALVVHGEDGLDEVSLSSTTLARLVCGAETECFTWNADDFGLEPVARDELRVSGPQESAAVIRRIVEGEAGPAARIVIANTAAALFTAGKVQAIKDGVNVAKEAQSNGRAKSVLDTLVRETNR